MKKILLPVLLLLFVNGYAQTRDLISLAKGDFLGMNALFDEDESLFGYISIYDYGKTGDKTKKFEYVLLDKNLNPFANNTFEGDITAGDYYGYINFDGAIVLKPSSVDYSLVKPNDMFTPSSMVIDLKDNSVKRKVFYDYDHGVFNELEQNDTWRDKRKEFRTEKKQNSFNYISTVAEIKEGGYLVHEYDAYRGYVQNSHLMRYDENKKEMWRYSYNETATKKQWQVLYALEKDEKYYYALLKNHAKVEFDKDYGTPVTVYKKPDTYSLLVLDMKTGKEVHKKQIADSAELLSEILSFPTYSYGYLDNDKSFDDKIVIVGRTSNALYTTGITRLVIDRNTFNVELKVLSYGNDFKAHIPKINATGFVEKGYMLDPRDLFFMKDGSVGILFEKYRPASEYRGVKTTDIVYVNTDSAFNIKSVTVLEKEKTKWYNSDYLFSQYLNDGNDLVFFYRDYQQNEETKDKNWNLYINTFIDSKFKQEMIPISAKEKFLIFPYIAKEGFILLQEINKKDKYNQVRLERLNY